MVFSSMIREPGPKLGHVCRREKQQALAASQRKEKRAPNARIVASSNPIVTCNLGAPRVSHHHMTMSVADSVTDSDKGYIASDDMPRSAVPAAASPPLQSERSPAQFGSG